MEGMDWSSPFGSRSGWFSVNVTLALDFPQDWIFLFVARWRSAKPLLNPSLVLAVRDPTGEMFNYDLLERAFKVQETIFQGFENS